MKIAKIILWILGIWALCIVFFGTIEGVRQYGTKEGAILLMMASIGFFWILPAGLASRYLNSFFLIIKNISIGYKIKFILFATIMALLEEAVTVSITNLGPIFGVPYGQVWITASGNYIDVVLFHSVIVFIPMFIAWAYLLSKYDFSPLGTMILFGINGICAELLLGNFSAIPLAGFWIFVYGLMIYAPACCLPGREVKKPGLIQYLMAIILPILASVPVALVVSKIHPVAIHFVH